MTISTLVSVDGDVIQQLERRFTRSLVVVDHLHGEQLEVLLIDAITVATVLERDKPRQVLCMGSSQSRP